MNYQQLVMNAGAVIGITGEPTVPFYGIKTADGRVWNPVVCAEHTTELAMTLGIATCGNAASIHLPDNSVVSELAEPEPDDCGITQLQRSIVLVANRLYELGHRGITTSIQDVAISIEFDNGEITAMQFVRESEAADINFDV